GFVIGLKLPCIVFGTGLCFAFFGVSGPFRRRFMLSFIFGLGILAGIAITYGYWGWFLGHHFSNPMFPYFNDFFKSPLAPLSSARDVQFLPRSAHDFLLFPFIFTDSPFRTGEIPWRDWRILILYVLLPLALLARLGFGRSKQNSDALARPSAARYLLWAAVISYFLWALMFAIYRYLVPLEMLAPLLIVLAIGMLPLKLQTRGLIAAFILIVIAASIQGGNWSRRASWSDYFIETGVPALGKTSDLMILMAGFDPYSHVIPQFPPDIAFVRIQSNFTSPDQNKGMNAVLHARVEAHKGRYMLLIAGWQKKQAAEALGYYHLALAPGPCQTVVDHLYGDTPLDLCQVTRLNQ
ncbi:MAG TPA: hypothetical protein VFR09_03945, partial [Alphaproteobacteria bacterium]|nr:hypothetical protein [Alphaproteobacteria bacterium]